MQEIHHEARKQSRDWKVNLIRRDIAAPANSV